MRAGGWRARSGSGRAVFAGDFGGGEGVLGVDDFEHGGLAGGVAQAGEAEAFARRSATLSIEGGELVAGDGGFGVELFELGDEAALGGGEGDLGGIAADLALLDLCSVANQSQTGMSRVAVAE